MRKTHTLTILLILGLAGFLLVASPIAPQAAPPPPDEPVDTVVRLSEGDGGRPVALTQAQTLVVDLESNPSTGYRWELAGADDRVVRHVETTYEPYGEQDSAARDASERASAPAAGRVGAPVRQVMRFRAVGRGRTTLSLV